MKQKIKLREIYQTDLYARSRVSELVKHIDSEAKSIELDFADVGFISRSFSDELYNVIEKDGRDFSFIHQNDEVKAMMLMVKDGRNKERSRGVSNARIYNMDSVSSLSKYFLTM